jgi:membrane protein YdbS with pleckstrin-like domain
MDDLTNQGIQALRGGEKARARSLFLSALEIDADNAQAWLWLSGAVESEQDRLDCLEQVLRIDPNNQAAAKGIALLVGKGLVPAEVHEQPGNEPDLHPHEKGQESGWQHEMPEETSPAPAAPTPELTPAPEVTPSSEMAPVSEAVTAPPETPGGVEVPVSISETPPQEAAPEPDVTVKAPAEEPYELPESLFQPTEAADDRFPEWMATLTPEDAVLSPAATPEQAKIASAESGAAPMAAATSEAVIQAPSESMPQVTETPAAVVRPEEKTLLNLRPSLVTTVVVYGAGAIILLAATMGLLLTITNADSIVLIGLILVVCLLIAMLTLLVLETIGHLMTRFTLTNLRVYIENGVFRRSHQSISFPKIKSISLHQGLLQKIIGIGTLTVHAATPDGKEELARLVDVPKAVEVLNRIETARKGES